MRTGTGILLLVLILLVAAYGWKVLGVLAIAVLLVPVLLVLAAFAALLWFRRRARQAAQHFEQALREAQARQAGTHHRDAIDVEARDVTDERLP